MPQVCAGELLFHHTQGAAPVDHRAVTSKDLSQIFMWSPRQKQDSLIMHTKPGDGNNLSILGIEITAAVS